MRDYKILAKSEDGRQRVRFTCNTCGEPVEMISTSVGVESSVCPRCSIPRDSEGSTEYPIEEPQFYKDKSCIKVTVNCFVSELIPTVEAAIERANNSDKYACTSPEPYFPEHMRDIRWDRPFDFSQPHKPDQKRTF